MSGVTINILSTADGPEALLSNFAHTPFSLDGVPCESVEGLIQGLKEERFDRQLRICLKHGFEAKRASSRKRNARVRESGHVWWQGKPIPFKSDEYYALIERALRAKFDANGDARTALLSTTGMRLEHDTGKPESANTSFPKERFIHFLSAIRDAFLG